MSTIDALPLQDLKPKSMPVLVIMPDNKLSYGVRCDASPPEAGKTEAEGVACGAERGTALTGGAQADAAPTPYAPSVVMPLHADSLPSTRGSRDGAAWQHGFDCGTAAAAAAFSEQNSIRDAAQPGGGDSHGAAHAAEGDVESGPRITVRSLRPVCDGSSSLSSQVSNLQRVHAVRWLPLEACPLLLCRAIAICRHPTPGDNVLVACITTSLTPYAHASGWANSRSRRHSGLRPHSSCWEAAVSERRLPTCCASAVGQPRSHCGG